jgi:2-polyprenyl-6-hydroxyphenyl methylase/3-demethylubiquinone-9 3-methyltransferase
MIEIAKLHALESGVSVDYRCQSAESLLPLERAHYGIVSCMEMLEHVPEPAAMLNTLSALTAPGGAVFVSTINRHWRAFVGAIVGAEYLLRLLPRGTHEFARFIKPSELARWGRDAGLVLEDIRGLDYHPVTEIAQLSDDPRVNYIACFAKPA